MRRLAHHPSQLARPHHPDRYGTSRLGFDQHDRNDIGRARRPSWTSPLEWTSTGRSRRRSNAPPDSRAKGFTRMWSSQIFGPDTLDRARGRRTRVPRPRPRHGRRADPDAPPDDARGPSAHGARGHRRTTLPRHRPLAQGRRSRACGASPSIVRRSYMAEYLDALAPMLRGEKRRGPRGTRERHDDRRPGTERGSNAGSLDGRAGAEDARDGRHLRRRHADLDDRREDDRHARRADDQRRGRGGRAAGAARRVQPADLGDRRRRRHA